MNRERLLQLMATHDCTDQLHWNSELQFAINCSDIFLWGCADIDIEPIETDADLDLLEQCLQEAKDNGPLLYCARRRHMRPHVTTYSIVLDANYWALFDDCGPYRETGLGNPEPRPDTKGSQ